LKGFRRVTTQVSYCTLGIFKLNYIILYPFKTDVRLILHKISVQTSQRKKSVSLLKKNQQNAQIIHIFSIYSTYMLVKYISFVHFAGFPLTISYNITDGVEHIHYEGQQTSAVEGRCVYENSTKPKNTLCRGRSYLLLHLAVHKFTHWALTVNSICNEISCTKLHQLHQIYTWDLK
jgi:hypothetical protein